MVPLQNEAASLAVEWLALIADHNETAIRGDRLDDDVAVLYEWAGKQLDTAGGFDAVLRGRWDETVNRSEGH